MNAPRIREYLLCPPTHFAVTYRINPWMDPTTPVDRELAGKQWQQLRETLTALGHRVHELVPAPGLPDLVYTANGGFVLDGTAYGARFRHRQRAAETAHHLDWYRRHGWRYHAPTEVNEGEGDLAWTGELILAGYGFRTDPAAHREVRDVFGYPVLSLRLVDPRFYHLDTALAVLRETDRRHPGGPHTHRYGAAADGSGRPRIAYYPGAFSPESQRLLHRLYPDAVLADETDAAAFGLNLVSDGRHVVLNADADAMAAKLSAAGYTPVPVDLSELRKGGGSGKCCVQELRR